MVEAPGKVRVAETDGVGRTMLGRMEVAKGVDLVGVARAGRDPVESGLHWLR